MNLSVTGLHHITAIASDPQENIDFYAGLLGLRWVKRTVNFDDPSAYHLYYGDKVGSPGTAITFFYWPGAENRGRVGSGQSTAITFSLPSASFDFWEGRLSNNGVSVTRLSRSTEDVLKFADPDGISIEFVSSSNDEREGWHSPSIPSAHSLLGMHSFQLTVRDMGPTEKVLTEQLGFRIVDRNDDRVRLESGQGGPGTYADIIEGSKVAAGIGGVGTVHHVAFSMPDETSQRQKRLELQAAGLHVSEVMNRDYFRSIYFREFGGILFEIATAGPGFAIDESVESLGSALKLPLGLESRRAAIERSLPPLNDPRVFE